ncbi:unnamed protein product [Urochloa decumbens]|uniref:Uncharacterized protein n=1 Tax=Urochloa decumbens TaxID=240449 RepID=A0ABC8ZYK1_9POAL
MRGFFSTRTRGCWFWFGLHFAVKEEKAVAARPRRRPSPEGRMADHSPGLFSTVFSSLRAACSSWSWRRNDAAARDTQLGQEATVRSRLARRAGAARRFGRNLAFVSFNLEVLLFVYAFWRARRRNLNWRQPLQALPMLVIPALATLIYAAFVRFTRTLDLKDKKTLQRLQHQNECVQKGSESHHNGEDCAKKCDLVDDAISFSSESNQAETSKLGKHRQSSIDLRDDGGGPGGDGSWGHSKDFHPMHSNGLRRRIFSIEKTHITNSSAFRQLINWSSEHLSDDLEDPNLMGRTAEDRSHSGYVAVEKVAASSTAQISSLIPDCSITHIISNTMHHADFSSSMSPPESNEGLVEEDVVQTALPGPKPDLPAVTETHPERIENQSSKFHASEDNSTPFVSEEEQMSSYAVERVERHSGTSGFTLCSQETEKEDDAGGLCFVKISPELSFLSSPELILEGGKDASEKEPCDLGQNEDNNVAINLEEALFGVPLVNTAEPDYGNAGFSLRPQDSNMMEVPAVTKIFSVIPESDYSASVEVPADNYEHLKDDQTSDVHLTEQKVQEDFLDPLVVNFFEDSFASEFLSRSAAAEMTEVLGVVKEGLSEGASNHQNDVVASSDDGGDAENAISDSVSVQLIPEANIMEALQDAQETLSDPLHCSAAAGMTEVLGVAKEGLSQGASNRQNNDGGDAMNAISDSVSVQLIPEANIMEAIQDVQETLSDPLHRSSFRSGIFVSSSEINNDEAYSSNPNSLYAYSVENEESLASRGGSSVSKDEMNFAFLDTSILLNEVTSIPERNITQSLHDGKQALPMSSERANFDLEESLISLDQEINLEIFSLYSRSSSCVSEVNMTETLSARRFPALENDNDFSLEDMTSMMVTDVNHEVGSAEKNGSDSICAEAIMTEDIQGVNNSPSQSQEELPETYVFSDNANNPEHLRSSSSMPDDNLIELTACKEGSFHPKDENPSSFQETSPSESLSDNLMCASHTSKKESVTFSMKDSPDPSLEDVDSFDKVSGDEHANESLKENAIGCEQITRTQTEINCTENHVFTEGSKHNCTDASESVNEGFFEPEHQEPELVLSQIGMPFFIDEGEETDKYLGSSSTACALETETLQVLPVSAGSEKGFLDGSKAYEWRCTDKEPKDLGVKGMEEDVHDLDEPIGFLGGSDCTCSGTKSLCKGCTLERFADRYNN